MPDRALNAPACAGSAPPARAGAARAVLGIADVVTPEGSGAAPLPLGLRFLAPPFDFRDVLRAVRSCLRHAGFRLPDAEPLEA